MRITTPRTAPDSDTTVAIEKYLRCASQADLNYHVTPILRSDLLRLDCTSQQSADQENDIIRTMHFFEWLGRL